MESLVRQVKVQKILFRYGILSSHRDQAYKFSLTLAAFAATWLMTKVPYLRPVLSDLTELYRTDP